jgi:hypothetical protein
LFLGSIVTKSDGAEEDVRRSIDKTMKFLIQLYPVWKNENISRRTKLRLFIRNVKSFSLYCCETWEVTEPVVREPQVFINRCLGRTVNMIWL